MTYLLTLEASVFMTQSGLDYLASANETVLLFLFPYFGVEPIAQNRIHRLGDRNSEEL